MEIFFAVFLFISETKYKLIKHSENLRNHSSMKCFDVQVLSSLHTALYAVVMIRNECNSGLKFREFWSEI